MSKETLYAVTAQVETPDGEEHIFIGVAKTQVGIDKIKEERSPQGTVSWWVQTTVVEE